jgi:CheY-like chemotaxis protein
MIHPKAVDVLLVEDNPQHAEMMLRVFRRLNLADRVFIAKDGAEALAFLFSTAPFAERANESHPRVIFLDLKLPKIDGFEVLQRLRSDERTRLIPVVVLTTSRQEQDIVNSYRLGANSFITKPLSFDRFVQTISDAGQYWMVHNRPPMEDSI